MIIDGEKLMRVTNGRERRRGWAAKAREERRLALARIETLSASQCRSALARCQNYSFGFGNGSASDLQRAVLSAYARGELNARDIERAHQEDSRA